MKRKEKTYCVQLSEKTHALVLRLLYKRLAGKWKVKPIMDTVIYDGLRGKR